MADPFSIASGAVGIISGGIQLCREITKYTEAWRGYDGDIESINLKAKSLETPLKRLREFVEDTQLTDAEAANDISEKASELDRHLKRLKDKLVSVQPIISESRADQVKNKMRRVAYPLRARDALRDIKTDLNEVQSTIELALAIFNAQKAQKSSFMQERSIQLLEEIHLTISTTSRKDMPAPALLKSLCDRSDQCSDLSEPNSQYSSIIHDEDLNLYAAGRLSASTRYTKRVSHRVSTKTLFQYYSGWLRRQLTLSFSLSTGAGAFSIAPVLEVQVYRGEESWIENILKKAYTLRSVDEELICEFQQAISAGEVEPRDIVSPSGISIMMSVFHCYNFSHRYLGPKHIIMRKLLLFMVEAGFRPNNGVDPPLLYLFDYIWDSQYETFVLSLINHGIPIDWLPRTLQAKKNIKRLLVKDNDFGDLPEIAKIILRESALDLREALQSGIAKSNDIIKYRGEHFKSWLRHPSLLEFAVGWPDGVFILLEFGADASQVDIGLCPYRTIDGNDLYCDEFRDSLAPLLQRGCIVRSVDIRECKSKTIRTLLINELANRRTRLHDIARSCLPPSRLAEITGAGIEGSIIDTHAFQIYAELIGTNMMVPEFDRSLKCDPTSDTPVYHQISFGSGANLDALDELYLAGFRDVDLPDSKGFTPLMVALSSLSFFDSLLVWLVGKGASLSKRLPFSNTTIAHLITSRLVEKTLVSQSRTSGEYSHGDSIFPKSINDHKETIFLVPTIRDCCSCFCSDASGGCTTLSVALREFCKHFDYYGIITRQQPEAVKNIYFITLQSLISLTEETQMRDHTIIRLLTFEALGLRHTCCREISHHYSCEYYAEDIMDQEEIRNIQEEDQHIYEQLDELVEIFKTQFDDLQLPIFDFLNGPWHARMTQVLSTRDPYDEEHILENRKNGVFLEPVEFHDIPWFFNNFGSQIEELDTEGSCDGNGDSGDEDEGNDQSRNTK